MSQPAFPELDPDMTLDSAIFMILVSIAMEEAALSRIIDAEGEKIRYVLGTLDCRHNPKAGADDILAVNKSVNCVMETVTNSQMLLKTKMERALEAVCGEHVVPPRPPCPPEPPEPPCKRVCRCSAVFKTCDKRWRTGDFLPWICCNTTGGCVCAPHDGQKITLAPCARYMLSFAANIKPCRRDEPVAVSLRTISGGRSEDLFTYRFSGSAETLTASGIIVGTDDGGLHSVALKLVSPHELEVERAMFTVAEL